MTITSLYLLIMKHLFLLITSFIQTWPLIFVTSYRSITLYPSLFLWQNKKGAECNREARLQFCNSQDLNSETRELTCVGMQAVSHWVTNFLLAYFLYYISFTIFLCKKHKSFYYTTQENDDSSPLRNDTDRWTVRYMYFCLKNESDVTRDPRPRKCIGVHSFSLTSPSKLNFFVQTLFFNPVLILLLISVDTTRVVWYTIWFLSS